MRELVQLTDRPSRASLVCKDVSMTPAVCIDVPPSQGLWCFTPRSLRAFLSSHTNQSPTHAGQDRTRALSCSAARGWRRSPLHVLSVLAIVRCALPAAEAL